VYGEQAYKQVGEDDVQDMRVRPLTADNGGNSVWSILTKGKTNEAV
jgi:hypothetical protein